ncbi:hypothetical protein DS2_09392 [Catenovulum agarivorans DS-2]|uniref:Uncharacterized protein n=1 Tax=Catenovulum agarivorans DS-2 TaxID=1328313 RepID=W7QBH2_9ALTE|nr:hypothetical protein [Catenovulum agarivorans]EWH10149.1 hypothetical protein DS2_09392 [Catenovulum agarivorans DS-2]
MTIETEEYAVNAAKLGEWNHEFYASSGAGGKKWSDAVKYGFISAGGGKLQVNSRAEATVKAVNLKID